MKQIKKIFNLLNKVDKKKEELEQVKEDLVNSLNRVVTPIFNKELYSTNSIYLIKQTIRKDNFFNFAGMDIITITEEDEEGDYVSHFVIPTIVFEQTNAKEIKNLYNQLIKESEEKRKEMYRPSVEAQEKKELKRLLKKYKK